MARGPNLAGGMVYQLRTRIWLLSILHDCRWWRRRVQRAVGVKALNLNCLALPICWVCSLLDFEQICPVLIWQFFDIVSAQVKQRRNISQADKVQRSKEFEKPIPRLPILVSLFLFFIIQVFIILILIHPTVLASGIASGTTSVGAGSAEELDVHRPCHPPSLRFWQVNIQLGAN